jgi:chaperonin cofactor prefoldin
MSEETTHNLPDGRSFEERVFARFDALDARMVRVESRLDDMNARLQKLESESERRSIETKPIWERALAEIIAVGQKVDAVERKLNVLGLDMLTLRPDQTRLESRMDKLDSEPAR